MSDPYNFRAMELFCNVCNMSGNQKLVWDLIKEKSVDIRKFHPQVILIVAEALSDDLRKAEVNPCISDLLEYVSKSRLEEGEIKKLVLGYRKMGDNEKAISVIAEAIGKNPALRKSASLLQIKGKAQIDLAKKCIDTTKNKLASTQIKARAWDECRSYLLEAEKDLKEALECARNAIEREYIEKDLEFLKYMQEIARKPGVRHPRFKRKR